MTTRSQSRRFYGGLFVLFFGTLLILAAAVAHGPDRELSLVREVPSKSSASGLGSLLSDPTSWPSWFFSLSEAKLLNPGPLAPGSEILLKMDPKKSPWSKFDLRARVTEYVPDRLLVLRIEQDSTDRLTRLFDLLEWRVEILPPRPGIPFEASIRGVSRAHTRHWRARLMGTIAERIVMHQVYYPNLIKLAELKPSSAKSARSGSPIQPTSQDR